MNKFLSFVLVFTFASSLLVGTSKVNKFSIDPDRLTRAIPEESQIEYYEDAFARSALPTRRPASSGQQTIVKNSSPRAFLGGNQR